MTVNCYPHCAISSSPACCSKLFDKDSRMSLDTNRATSLTSGGEKKRVVKKREKREGGKKEGIKVRREKEKEWWI